MSEAQLEETFGERSRRSISVDDESAMPDANVMEQMNLQAAIRLQNEDYTQPVPSDFRSASTLPAIDTSASSSQT